jgi:hypothetical protein
MFEIATVVLVLGIFAAFGFAAFKAEREVGAKAKKEREARAKSGPQAKSKADKSKKKQS